MQDEPSFDELPMEESFLNVEESVEEEPGIGDVKAKTGLIVDDTQQEEAEDLEGQNKDTRETCVLLKTKFSKVEKVSYSELVDGKSRREAVKTFYQMLYLTTKDYLNVCQDENANLRDRGEIWAMPKVRIYFMVY